MPTQAAALGGGPMGLYGLIVVVVGGIEASSVCCHLSSKATSVDPLPTVVDSADDMLHHHGSASLDFILGAW